MAYDIHKSVGIVSAAFLIVIAFTGVYMEFPRAFHRAARTIGKSSRPPKCESVVQPGVQPLTADRALELASQLYPDARFDHLHPPEGERGTYEVAFRQHDEVQQSYGRTQVFLDQYSGKVLARYSPDDFTATDAFFAWQFPLHNGEAFGLLGRWVVFVFGFIPAVLYATGAMLWWRKRQSRKRQLRTRQLADLKSRSVTEPAAPSASPSRERELHEAPVSS